MRIFSFVVHSAVLITCVHLRPIFGGWIDPDTPSEAYKTVSNVDGRTHNLVFSDEFNVDKRKFKDGYDPRWTAVNKNDYTNYALHYYNEDLATTGNGYLNISTIYKDVSFKAQSATNPNKFEKKTKNYQSAMINGWNKFCFTGGIIEFNAQLPGYYDIGGLWPAMWLLGNLARSTYVGSSDNMWPWSYNTCNRKLQTSQEISACGIEHHWDMEGGVGRGAPEIDILEAMPGKEKLIHTPISKPYYSASLQVSPALKYRPLTGFPPDLKQWYFKGLDYGRNASLNIFFYGMALLHKQKMLDYNADAVSANRNLEETHFTNFHKYRLEWQSGSDGYLKWFLDDEFVYSIKASALNVSGSLIPDEPMYILLNTAMSSTWGFPAPCPKTCACDCFDCRNAECACAIPKNMCANLPAHFLIDSVRVYQNKENPNHVVGCSPPGKRSKRFIKGHKHRYMGEEDTTMLLPVLPGGERCKTSEDCGYGVCDSKEKKCVCQTGYTGPNCMAYEGYDEIDWDPDLKSISVKELFVPGTLWMIFIAVIAGLGAVVGYKYLYDKDQRGSYRMNSMGHYTTVNNVSISPPNISTYQSIQN